MSQRGTGFAGITLAASVMLFAGAPADGAVTFNNAATGLDYTTAGNWSSGWVPKAGDGTVEINGTYAVTLNSDVSANIPEGLVIGNGAANSSLTLGAAAALQIGSTLNLGAYPGSGGGGFWGRGTLTMNGGSLHVGTGDAIRVGYSPSSTGGTLALNNGAALQYDGATLAVGVGGSGSSGTVTVNAGATLNAPSATLGVGNPAGNSGTVNINGGSVTLAAMSLGMTSYNAGSGGTVTQTNGTVLVNGNVVLGPNGSTSTATGKYSLSGGTLRIGGVNGLTGGGSTYGYGLLTLTGGRLETNAIRRGRASAGLTTNFSGGTVGAYSSAGLVISAPVNLLSDGTGAIFDTTTGAISVTGVLSGAGGFTKTGTGTITLASASNAFAGDVTIAQGTLAFSGTGALPAATPVGVTFGASGTAGTLDLSGINQQVTSLGIASDATATNQVITTSKAATTARLTFAGGIASSSFGGVLQDGGTGKALALTIAGGSLSLSGANTYSGGTLITGGKLLVTNSSGSGTGSGAVNVNGAAAILGGIGTISGAVTIDAGSLAPGSSPGILRIDSSLTLNGGSADFELGAASSDQVLVNTLSNVTSTALHFGGVLNVTVYAGDAPAYAANQVFDLFDWGSNTVVSGEFLSVNLPALPQGLGWRNYGTPETPMYFDATTGQIQVVAIPEPTALAFTGMAMSLGWLGRRRRAQ